MTATGACRFCGQVATQKGLKGWSQGDEDELTTETCNCIDARIYARKKKQKEKVAFSIDKLFGKENGDIKVPDEAVDLLYKTIHPICEGFIQGITVDMGKDIKCKISVTSKGYIKVTRTKTDKGSYEA